MGLEIGKNYKTNIGLTFFCHRDNAESVDFENLDFSDLWVEVPEGIIFLIVDSYQIKPTKFIPNRIETEYHIFWNEKIYYVKYTQDEIDWFLSTKNFEEVV